MSARTQEVGVRVALGAARSDIVWMFLERGIVLGFAGIAIAVPLAYAAGRGMSVLLFGVSAGDLLVYLLAAAVAGGMTVASSLHPALRAASIDPAITIRAE